MTIYIVFKVQDEAKMKSAIEAAYPNDNFFLGKGEWLVSDRNPVKVVSDKIGITGNAPDVPSLAGSAIVFSMGNYFGRAPTNIWEWIKSKSEETDG